MTDEPLISVIIPVYNRAYLLGRSIDSVLQQNYTNLEIIIVDDASTEDIETVVNQIADKRLKYIRHPENLGGANARNTGIKAATGHYIALLDSDDTWYPEKLTEQLSVINQHSTPEKLVVYTQVNYDNGEVITVLPDRPRNPGEPLGDYLFVHIGLIHTSSLFMTRELAVNTLFKSGLKKHQDLDFCFRLEEKGAIFALVEKPLVMWYAELNRSDRMTNNRKVDLSISWINEKRPVISEKARLGFLMRDVVYALVENHHRRWEAEKIIIQAFLAKLITLEVFLKKTGFALLPKPLRLSLKKLINQILKR